MFFDRHDAGERLAQKLLVYRDKKTVIYALPRGGVPIGFEVAKELGSPLDLVIAQKVGHPCNSEYALCAITEDGERICDESGLCGIDEAWINLESDIQRKEACRRRIVYKGSKKIISARGKVAILVDDGIATGLSMKASVRAIQKQKPSSVVIAVPVAPHTAVVELRRLVDDVIVLEDVDHFTSGVGAYYTHFPQVSDEEVIASLKEAKDFSLKQAKNITLKNPMRSFAQVAI